MKKPAIFASALVFALVVIGAADDDLGPFATPEAYRQIGEINFDIPLLLSGIGAYWVEHKAWPQTIDEVDKGFNIWLRSLANDEKEARQGRKLLDVKAAFQIEEVIPMWHGVAYRLTYKKEEFTFSGMIVLSESNTVEGVMTSTQYSQSLGRILHSLPF